MVAFTARRVIETGVGVLYCIEYWMGLGAANAACFTYCNVLNIGKVSEAAGQSFKLMTILVLVFSHTATAIRLVSTYIPAILLRRQPLYFCLFLPHSRCGPGIMVKPLDLGSFCSRKFPLCQHNVLIKTLILHKSNEQNVINS